MSNMTKEQKEQGFKEVYLDANLFIYSVLNNAEIGEKSRKIIENVKNNIYNGFTSTLTIDEILWAVQKEIGKEKAADIAKDFIAMQNLQIIPVSIDVIKKSIEFYKRSLNPRDAIHLAAMQSKGIKIMISSDLDFDKIKEIRRIDFAK